MDSKRKFIVYTMTPERMAVHNYAIAKLRAMINNVGVSIAQNYEVIKQIKKLFKQIEG